MYAFQCISLPFRPPKPRTVGLTMMLDKNLGLQGLKDFLDAAAEYVDIVKFGWGTARVFPRDLICRKVELLRRHHVSVCPGGTFLEVAYAQNRVPAFLKEADEIGFDCIEVSDGTLSIPHDDKLDMIRRAKDAGFTVVSEVGKKNEMEDRRYSIPERTEHALKELAAGSFKVISEARECGSFGIFDKSGEIIPEFLEQFASQVGGHNIIFEAPIVHQQQWLISNLGNAVNLGNIPPDSCINLETLRCGLRSGTLKEYHLDATAVFIENGVPGALNAAARDDVIVVVDVLRCSTTVVAALASGIKSVKPVSSVEECVGDLTAGERGGVKIARLMYDNSPVVFRNGSFAGRELVLTATNGTECIKASATHNSPVLVGALVNARAAALRALELARATRRNITIVMAGRNNQIASEDLVGASEIVANLKECTLKGYLKPVYSGDSVRDLMESEGGRNLIAHGKREDVLFCAQKDLYDLVPEFQGGVLVVSRPSQEAAKLVRGEFGGSRRPERAK